MKLSSTTTFRAAAATFAATLLMLTLGANAFAATEIGSRCTAASAPIGTLIQTATAGPGEPYIAPVGGIIVRWGSNLPTGTIDLPSKLKTVRATANPAEWLIVSESTTGSIVGGVNEFAARVPITAGDRIALFGATGAAVCLADGPGDILTGIMGATDPLPGETHATFGGPNARVAAWAAIEPDADGDGFGDETQDFCPSRAEFQIACPIVKLRKFVLGGTKTFDVIVTSSTESPVTLSGSARVPAHGGKRATTIKFKRVKKTVKQDGLTRFKLKLPRKLQSALRRIPPGVKVKLTLKLQGVGVANTDTQTIRATLRGRR